MGSRLHHCLRVPAGITSFDSEVTAFVPDRLIELVSDTRPPFRVRQTLEPTLYGCQPIHEEWLTPDAAPLQATGEDRPLLYLLRRLRAAIGLSRPRARSSNRHGAKPCVTSCSARSACG